MDLTDSNKQALSVTPDNTAFHPLLERKLEDLQKQIRINHKNITKLYKSHANLEFGRSESCKTTEQVYNLVSRIDFLEELLFSSLESKSTAKGATTDPPVTASTTKASAHEATTHPTTEKAKLPDTAPKPKVLSQESGMLPLETEDSEMLVPFEVDRPYGTHSNYLNYDYSCLLPSSFEDFTPPTSPPPSLGKAVQLAMDECGDPFQTPKRKLSVAKHEETTPPFKKHIKSRLAA